MELLNLRYIIAVAEEGNLSKAAHKLFISQPTLTQSIQKTEGELGITLFHRTSHGMLLTEDGNRFIQKAKEIIQIKERIDFEMAAFSKNGSENLKLGLPNLWGGVILASIFPSFYHTYPNIAVTINEMPSSRLENMLLDKKCDLAIIAVPENQQNFNKELDYMLLLSEEILIAIPPNHPICSSLTVQPGQEFPLISPNQLQYQPIINYNMDAPLRSITDLILQQHELHPKVIANVASATTANQLSLCGLGYTLIPRTFAKYCMPPPHPIYCSLNMLPLPRLNLMMAWIKTQKLPPHLKYLIHLFQTMDLN